MKGAQNGKKQGLMRSIILGYEVLFLIFFALRGLIPSDFHFGNDLLRMASGISVLLVLVLTYIEFGEKPIGLARLCFSPSISWRWCSSYDDGGNTFWIGSFYSCIRPDRKKQAVCETVQLMRHLQD